MLQPVSATIFDILLQSDCHTLFHLPEATHHHLPIYAMLFQAKPSAAAAGHVRGDGGWSNAEHYDASNASSPQHHQLLDGTTVGKRITDHPTIADG